MKNKIYYTAEKDLAFDGQIEYTTGLTDIYLYKIENNELVTIGNLTNKADSHGDYLLTNEETISDFIDEFVPEYNTDNIEFIRL